MRTVVVDGMEIAPSNFRSVAYHLKMPYAFFENWLDGRAAEKLPRDESDIAFFDIETDSAENFVFGVVNDRQFEDSAEMLAEIAKYQLAVSFNGFRFDHQVLFRSHPEFFSVMRFPGNFEMYSLRGMQQVDAFIAYLLWKPTNVTHKLDMLARDLGIDRHYGLDDKVNKCLEDVGILRQFWPYARELFDFVHEQFRIDAFTLCVQSPRYTGKFRRWFLQSYLLQQGIFPQLVQREHAEKPRAFYHCRRGFYRDVHVFDVASAYPTTAVNLQSTLYKQGDFASFMQHMIGQRREHPAIDEFVKWCCNALIGDMNNTDGVLYDKSIMSSVWNAFHDGMQAWVKRIGMKNVLYAYTDCVYTQKGQVPEFKGYTVREKAAFRWLMIYNIERLLGLTAGGKIHKTHFNRIPAQLRMYDYIDAAIEKELLKNPEKFIRKPFLPLDLRALPERAFSITIRKDANECRNVEYLSIWAQLQMGFNEVYFSKDGISPDKKKIDYKQYEKLAKQYVKLFRAGI